MAGRRGRDIVLRDKAGGNEVELQLFQDSRTIPGGYSTEFSPLQAPGRTSGRASYQTQPPEAGLVTTHRSFHNGMGQVYYRDSQGPDTGPDEDRYSYTDGVVAFFPGKATLGYQEDWVDHTLQNGRVNDSSTAGWDNNTNATVAVNADARTGDHGLRCTATGATAAVGQTYRGTIGILQSIEIQFWGYAKRVSGSGNVLLRIQETGTGNVATDSSTVTASEYTFLDTGTVTLVADLSALDFQIIISDSSSVFDLDDMYVSIRDVNAEWTQPVQFKGDLYSASGVGIFKWSEADDAWYLVYNDTSDSGNDITWLESFSDSGTTAALYAGRGDAGDNYLRSTDGATWADPTTNAGNARLAKYFLKMRNVNGDPALMKVRGNQVAITTNPSDTVNWGNEIQVGDNDRAITSIFSVNDAAYVGREDGLWVFNPVDNKFEDVEPDANFFPHPKNYSRAIGRGGSIFAIGGDHSLFRIAPIDDNNNFAWEDISELVSHPEWTGFGGGVRALTQDRKSIWLALDGGDREVTRSVTASPLTGTNRNSSSDGNNVAWVASNAGTLSNAIDTRNDGIVAWWVDFGNINPVGVKSDHLQFQMGANNFSIPAGATPVGVRATLYGAPYDGDNEYRITDVKLLNDSGTAIGTDQSGDQNMKGSTKWVFGDATNDWDGSLTTTIVNSGNFGFEVQIETLIETDINIPYFDYAEVQLFYTTTGTDQSRYMQLRQQGGSMVPHTVGTFLLEDPDRMARYYDNTNTQTSLFALGRTTNADAGAVESRIYRVRLPVPDQDLSALQSPEFRLTGQMFLQWSDYEYADVNKALLSLTINGNLSSTQTVTAFVKFDNATNDDGSDWTQWGDGGSTNDGVFDSTSEKQLAFLTTPQGFRRVRLRFDFLTASRTSAPEIHSVVLKAAWNPDRVGSKRWVQQFVLGPPRASQVENDKTKATIDTLEVLAGLPFIDMIESRGQGDKSHTVQITNVRDGFVRNQIGDDVETQHVVTLEIVRQDV